MTLQGAMLSRWLLLGFLPDRIRENIAPSNAHDKTLGLRPVYTDDADYRLHEPKEAELVIDVQTAKGLFQG